MFCQILLSQALLAPLSPPVLTQVDSYFARSFDWVRKAMLLYHDEMLLVCGWCGHCVISKAFALVATTDPNGYTESCALDTGTSDTDESIVGKCHLASI